ncbi:tetratricopeptide repeat protein [Peptacetobacter sp.]|uniref:tetratricopeptide repeat protein n=1 Tax=Peptacetobacter sp. TaxID=2991975 RepID=UPI002607AE68|nr:tetratricopeptide repeat protein [Peptacetobacter sp.]
MGWFSRKKKEKVNETEKIDNSINIEDSIKKIEELKKELKNCDSIKKVTLLNDIGGIYYKILDYDNAVIYYEESLNIEKTIGKAYTNLLNIYNIKRREAAVNKDDEKLQYYLNKIDDMMKISKDVVRGNV